MIDPGVLGGTRLSARARAAAPFHAMRVLARAKALEAAGRSILHLEIGEPDFPSPAPAIEAARRALDAGLTHYTPAAGLPALREAIALYYGRRYGVALEPGRVLVAPGASGALQLALLAALDPGDRVMIADPGYPCYRQVARALGIEPLAVGLDAVNGWRLDRRLAEAAWTEGTRALLVASPANPTGAVLSAAELADLYALCRERGATLIVDEIYQGLIYDTPDCTALALGSEGLTVVNSCSKYFGMTGWRVGWAVASPSAMGAMERLAQNLFVATGTLAQYAACAVLAPAAQDILEERRAVYAVRRRLLLEGLRALGLRIACDPPGAFYCYAALPEGTRLDSMAYCEALLDAQGVAIAPGGDFGDRRAAEHVRFAYTRPAVEIEAALARLAQFRP